MNKDVLQTPIQTPIRRISDNGIDPQSNKNLTLDFEAVTNVCCMLHENCAVCLSPFKCETLLKVTKCNHIFHKECLKEAKHKNASCPLCRTELTPNSTPRPSIRGLDIDYTDPDAYNSTIIGPSTQHSTISVESESSNINNSNAYNNRHPIVQAANRARNAVRLQMLRNSTTVD